MTAVATNRDHRDRLNDMARACSAAEEQVAALRSELAGVPAAIDELDVGVAEGEQGAIAAQARLRLAARQLPGAIAKAEAHAATLRREYEAQLVAHAAHERDVAAQRSAAVRDALTAELERLLLVEFPALAGRQSRANRAAAQAGAEARGQPQLEGQLLEQHQRAGVVEAIARAVASWMVSRPEQVDRELLARIVDPCGVAVERAARAFFDGEL